MQLFGPTNSGDEFIRFLFGVPRIIERIVIFRKVRYIRGVKSLKPHIPGEFMNKFAGRLRVCFVADQYIRIFCETLPTPLPSTSPDSATDYSDVLWIN